eukprot:11833773-Alexandrium_andersonii.AAC.1
MPQRNLAPRGTETEQHVVQGLGRRGQHDCHCCEEVDSAVGVVVEGSTCGGRGVGWSVQD